MGNLQLADAVLANAKYPLELYVLVNDRGQSCQQPHRNDPRKHSFHYSI